MWWASPLQMEIQQKRGRKERHGEVQYRCKTPKTPLSKSAYIPQVVHKEIMEYAELCRGSSPDPHWDQAFFCIPSHIQKVSGGLHYLLAKRPVNIFMALFLDNCLSTRKILFPRSVFSLLCIILKVINKLHPYRTKMQWVITKKVLNSKI